MADLISRQAAIDVLGRPQDRATDGKERGRMTREEAIKIINFYDLGFYDLNGEKIPADKLAEAFDVAIEALQRTSNAHPTHECVKPTHECVEPVGNSEQLNRTCAECKHYTKERLCVWWSYFGFQPEDYCSRWEERV